MISLGRTLESEMITMNEKLNNITNEANAENNNVRVLTDEEAAQVSGGNVKVIFEKSDKIPSYEIYIYENTIKPNFEMKIIE